MCMCRVESVVGEGVGHSICITGEPRYNETCYTYIVVKLPEELFCTKV